MSSFNTYKMGALAALICISMISCAKDEATIAVTEENFSHAETARNFRNWANQGAIKEFVKLPGLPPRGKAAATVQMNDDTLYGAAIVEAVDGEVTFPYPRLIIIWPYKLSLNGGMASIMWWMMAAINCLLNRSSHFSFIALALKKVLSTRKKA